MPVRYKETMVHLFPQMISTHDMESTRCDMGDCLQSLLGSEKQLAEEYNMSIGM